MFTHLSFLDINYDDYFNKLVRIKHIGIIWDLYKPLNKKSLYGQIVSDPANVQVSYEAIFHDISRLKILTCFYKIIILTFQSVLLLGLFIQKYNDVFNKPKI